MKNPCELIDLALDRFIWGAAIMMAYAAAPVACALAVWKAPVKDISAGILIVAGMLLGIIQLATGHFWRRRNDELVRQFAEEEGTHATIYDFSRLPLIPPIVAFCLGYLAFTLMFASFPVATLLFALWNTTPEIFQWTTSRFVVFVLIAVPLQMLLWPFMQPRPLDVKNTSIVRGSYYGYYEQEN